MIKFSHSYHVFELSIAGLYAILSELLGLLCQRPPCHLIRSDELIYHSDTIQVHFILPAFVKE